MLPSLLLYDFAELLAYDRVAAATRARQLQLARPRQLPLRVRLAQLLRSLADRLDARVPPRDQLAVELG
ncbi:MAG: hypothetical protein JO023_21950 [Chloroflexi bacterium]|nr:hypothetical protein [Chloroflexota bacterium]